MTRVSVLNIEMQMGVVSSVRVLVNKGHASTFPPRNRMSSLVPTSRGQRGRQCQAFLGDMRKVSPLPSSAHPESLQTHTDTPGFPYASPNC